MATQKILSRPADALPRRIADRIVITPQGCWEAVSSITNAGYGCARVDGRVQLLHRVAYSNAVGVIPSGLQIDHLCRNRACCNPLHPEAVTPQINSLRSPLIRFNSGNARKTHCKRGHPFSEENTYAYAGRRLCRACRRAANQRFILK